MLRTEERWIKASHRLIGVKENPWLIVDFQSLGRFDEEIVALNRKVQSNRLEMIYEMQRLFDHSRLWVLSGYELVRILKNKDPNQYSSIYKKFRQVRIPLAKYEEPGKGSFAIAQLAFSPESKDIGWVVQNGNFITREELATELLDTILST